MKIFMLLTSLLLLSCAKKYDCVKYGPKYSSRFMVEFNYQGKFDTLIVDDYDVKEHWTTFEVLDDRYKTIAQYPKNQTVYRKLRDTSIITGETCIEWKDKK
jgi:hypothetical protein